MEKSLAEQMHEISEKINDDEFLKSASNEELIAYLFLVEKMKKKLKKACEL